MTLTSFRKWLLAGTGLTLALGLSLMATARPGGGPGGCRHGGTDGGPGGGFEAAIEELDLDSESRARVDSILDEARSESRALRRDLREAREEMRGLFGAGDSDEATLVAQAEQVSALELQLHKQRIATHLHLRTVLSADQMESLGANLPKKRRHGRKRFKN